MKKLRLLGQATLLAVAITTAGFTSAQAQSGSSNPSADSFWDTVENPPGWVPKNQPYGGIIKENPPLKNPSNYSKQRKNSGHDHNDSAYSKQKKNSGYKHDNSAYGKQKKNSGSKQAKPGAFAYCQQKQAKAKQAVDKVYKKHKTTKSHHCKMEDWYAKELREIEEAEKRCEELRSDTITKEAQVQQ